MQTKLTLRMDSDLIERAKKVADERKTSLSRMVADYFDALIRESGDEPGNLIPPKTKALLGVLKGGTVDESDYEDYLERKYS